MKKLRNSLIAFVLVVIMSGSALLLGGIGSIANAASSQHVSTSSAAGKSSQSMAYGRYVWCPVLGMAC